MIVVLIVGILAVIAIPNRSTTSARAMAAAVKSNCRTIQLAAEDFAVQNDGAYAVDVDNSQTLSGKTITDRFPNGMLLDNPFTKARTQPVNGSASDTGEIGYTRIQQNGSNAGYSITAVGKTPNMTILALISGQWVTAGTESAYLPFPNREKD